ncbi:hypothetical protein SDJN02_26024, partial [Cucurbita argyrosperma subsp. argyrosperma]
MYCESRKEIQDNATNGQDFMEKSYNSPRGVPPRRPSSLWRLLLEIRVELSEQSRFKLSVMKTCSWHPWSATSMLSVRNFCVKTLQFDMEEICNFGRFVESAASTGNVSVMYVVDLTTAVYYQKCHDPDCGGYRSPLRPSPIDAIPNPRVSTDSEQISNGIESSN